MIKLDDVVEFIHNPLAYEQKLVSLINTKGEQILLSSFSELYNENSTIKVEGMEKFCVNIYNKCQYLSLKYDHSGPITCHAFIAKDDAPSFPLHTDPDDVIILCVEGTKKLLINNEANSMRNEACSFSKEAYSFSKGAYRFSSFKSYLMIYNYQHETCFMD
jgi:hypothetical protein